MRNLLLSSTHVLWANILLSLLPSQRDSAQDRAFHLISTLTSTTRPAMSFRTRVFSAGEEPASLFHACAVEGYTALFNPSIGRYRSGQRRSFHLILSPIPTVHPKCHSDR